MAMIELLKMVDQLYQYLDNNDKRTDAIRIKKIKSSLISEDKKNKNVQLKRLISMSSVKYLGDVSIKEFNNPNDWWNFLGELSALAKTEL